MDADISPGTRILVGLIGYRFDRFCRVFTGRKDFTRGGHQHLQIGRMLDIDLISESPHAPSPQMYVYKVWESVWLEGLEAIHS